MTEDTKKEAKVLELVESPEHVELIGKLRGEGHTLQINMTNDSANDRKFPEVRIVPKNEAECQEMFKCSEMELKAHGVSQLLYKISGAVLKSLKASDKPANEIAFEIQKLADDVTAASTRAAGKSAENRKKISKYDSFEIQAKELGISVDELISMKVEKVRAKNKK